MKLPRVKAGDAVTADDFNALLAAAERANLTVGDSAGLYLSSSPHGFTLGSVQPGFLWGKTTAGIVGGTYAFTEQFPAAAGTWGAGPRTGSAYEGNGNLTVPVGTYIQVYRLPSGDWRFWSDAC